MSTADVVVIGAGFGGLGAALRLAELGLDVTVLEALTYPGGCASTFTRQGYRFESGATLFSGFGEDQLFGGLIAKHGMDVELEWLDPVVRFRAPGFALDIPDTRDELIRRFVAMPGAPADALARFFAMQRQVADVLWDVLDEPELLPPFDAQTLLRHAARVPRYLPLAKLAGRPALDVLREFGLADFAPLRLFLDALCQITVQCSVTEAEAPFALATMDYYFRGTAHVRGGVGALAQEMVAAIERAGGSVRFAERATSIERAGDTWRVATRKGSYETEAVVANLIPQALGPLLGVAPGSEPAIDRRIDEVETGWGACMLYRALAPGAALPDKATHVEIVQDPALPLVEGNHLFCSLSSPEDDRGPTGVRTLTVSTHVRPADIDALPPEHQSAFVARIQERMRAGLARFAPEFCEDVRLELTASPRTFERFTGRPQGWVGGVPRRAGYHNYRGLLPSPLRPGLYLVGDSVFPGQGALATAIGGLRVAESLRRTLALS